MFQRKTWVSALSILAIAVPLVASAQDQPAAEQPQPAAQTQRTGIEEIVVTARKVTENLQETPLAVSAFDTGMIESLGISDTQDVTSLAPNLYITQTPGSVANMALAIRGIGGAEPLLTREQGVALYVDGAYLPRVTGAIMELVDIERVEILRGPQGTLYGRNATGGAVNFISRRPGEDFEFSSRVGTGEWSRFEWLTRVNTGELFEGFAASLSYLHSQRDGFRNNRLADDNSDFGAKNTDAFHIALRWDVTEDFTANYKFDYSDLEGHGPGFQLIAIDSTLAGALANGGVNVANLDIRKKAFDSLNNDFDGRSDHLIRGHNLTLEWDLGFATLTSITTYRDWENVEAGTELDGNELGTVAVIPGGANVPCNGTLPGNPCDLFNATNVRDADSFSEEFRINGDLGDQFRYVVGAYYFDEDFNENNFQTFLFPASPFIPPIALSNPFVYRGDADSWAIFLNGTYTFPFLDDRLSATAGIRYSEDQKSFRRINDPSTGLPPVSSGSNKWDSVDWEANLSFLVTENVSTYFRAATAYKAGGYNLRSTVDPVIPFDEERLTSVEAGIKSEFFDNRVRLNLAGFWGLYKDLQTDVFTAGPSGATSTTVNAGEAEIPGLEFEFLAVPIDGLTLNANVGWIKPEYNEYNFTVGGVTTNVADDAEFGYKPETTATLGAEYATAPLGSLGWVLTSRVDASYTASRVWSPLDDQGPGDLTKFRDALKDDGYWLFNARVTISEIAINDRARVKVAVSGRNLLDEDYLLSGIDFGVLGFAGGAYGEGRSWTLDLTLDY